MRIDMIMDLGWGSSGKGGICGYLAVRENYGTVACAYGRQAGHTYNNKVIGVKMMVQQLPIGVICPHVRDIFIGPGAIIHAETLLSEIDRYHHFLRGKHIVIHESAAIVSDRHAEEETARGQTKMGSTAKGVGRAMVQRINRDPDDLTAIARNCGALSDYVVNRVEYDWRFANSLAQSFDNGQKVLIEGAQGFGLSLYHGDWPYVTSRDVTPAQLMADVALPRTFHDEVSVVGVARTRPIRVNNRDGHSGPCYDDHTELTWEQVGVEPERTTVTQLERRVFGFSRNQIRHAAVHCLANGRDRAALTFCDYVGKVEVAAITSFFWKEFGIKIEFFVSGPDDADVEGPYE